jgi:hypothetical protein
MAKVEIAESLFEEIEKKFKQRATLVYDLIETLETNPRRGKPLGSVAGILIKEIRFEGFRFSFIVDGHKLIFLEEKDLTDLLIRFVRMSDKKRQEETIKEIKKILVTIGAGGFG